MKDAFKDIFINNVPLLDLRAPVEFEQGSFPHAMNIPLLTDIEREQVGTCYKQQGQEQAIELGHELVTGDVKAQRINAWKQFFSKYPTAHLYCFRGGMRSNLVQQWLREDELDVPLIKGGYKALRGYLLAILSRPMQMLRISGETGVGKTELLLELSHYIDLEGLARHRGSAFGKYIESQPSQIDFENELAIELLKYKSDTIILEDESHYIGKINLPYDFLQTMKESPVVILECSQEQRIDRIYSDYVVKQKQAYLIKDEENGAQLFDESLLAALQKIQKRLGGVSFKYLQDIMQRALQGNSESLHKHWISEILELYYDPMYQYQIDKKKDKIIFTGNKSEIQEFIGNEYY